VPSVSKSEALQRIEELRTEISEAIKEVTSLKKAINEYHVSQSFNTGVSIDVVKTPRAIRGNIPKKIKEVRSKLALLKKRYINQFPKEFESLEAKDIQRFRCLPGPALLDSKDLMVKVDAVLKSLQARKVNLDQRFEEIKGISPSDTSILRSALEKFTNGFVDSYLDTETTEDSLLADVKQKVAERDSAIVAFYNRLGNYQRELCRVNAERAAKNDPINFPPLDRLPSTGSTVLDTVLKTFDLSVAPVRGVTYLADSFSGWLKSQQYPRGISDCNPRIPLDCTNEFSQSKSQETQRSNEIDIDKLENSLLEELTKGTAVNSLSGAFESVYQQILRGSSILSASRVISAAGADLSGSLSSKINSFIRGLDKKYNTSKSRRERASFLSQAISLNKDIAAFNALSAEKKRESLRNQSGPILSRILAVISS
jgi:hypothetical protein